MIRKILFINAAIILTISAYYFICPAVRTLLDMRDPALEHPGIPKAAWRLFKNLTPTYAVWAEKRVAEGRAEKMSTEDISGTEWPLFGSVFYLWAAEGLQHAWDTGDHTAGVEPKVSARRTIIAASELVIDPRHASWVQKHWGGDYLHRENVFYRMLVIAALTSREKLLHDHAHLDILRDQVETFAKELDASSSGLLNDYPDQCYPGDVMEAVACIRRADEILGTDHSAFVARALRGFVGRNAASNKLPPYSADALTGRPLSPARGCGNSYMCVTSPELWPAQARQWFATYDRLYWDESLTAVGFREFGKDGPRIDWTMDVDAGPVIGGLGISASAFGLGAARKNGRFDRAYPLAVEMLATMQELPNGVLAMPRMLSNLSDAPLLGEAAVLWLVTIQPEKGFALKTGGHVPTLVYLILAGKLLIAFFLVLIALGRIQMARERPEYQAWAQALQVILWFGVLAGAVTAFCLGEWWSVLVILLAALILPIKKKLPPDEEVDAARNKAASGKAIEAKN